jgi:ATP-dependent DNA ligase
MLARLARELPREGHLYEPKWDGFRCLVFRDRGELDMRSRHGRPLARYFPELTGAFAAVPEPRFAVDGEIVVPAGDSLDFGALLKRLHPSPSRVERLRLETPAAFYAFDLLALGGHDLRGEPLAERRARLERLLGAGPAASPLRLTPATFDVQVAQGWLERFAGRGIDGVVAKPLELRYEAGRRAMVKVKRLRSVECVVAGVRLLPDGAVASLLLGLYDAGGQLRHVGVSSSFTRSQRRALAEELMPYAAELEGHPWEHGFGISGRPMGRLRGAAGVWTPDLPQDWLPLRPELVAEVAYDQLDEDRFRHPAGFVRWRPDREPRSCGFDQLEAPDVILPVDALAEDHLHRRR